MSQPPSRAERIRAALQSRFAPTVLEVADDSARHAGHSGARAEGETHFNILMVSDRFEGQVRVTRHRLVNEALAAEFKAGLHALALTLRTPGEAERIQRPG